MHTVNIYDVRMDQLAWGPTHSPYWCNNPSIWVKDKNTRKKKTTTYTWINLTALY